MQKHISQFGIFTVMLVIIGASSASAQSFNSYPTKNVLEYSLSSLYSRAEQIAQQNKWLEEEMINQKEEQKQLRYQSAMLDKEMGVLKDNTYQVKDEFDAQIRELQLNQTNTVILSKQLKELAEDETRLAKELEFGQRAKQRLQQDIAAAIDQLAQLDYEGLNESILKKDAELKLKKTQLSKLRAELFDEIALLQVKIENTNQNKPELLKDYRSLKSQQQDLRKQYQSLQSEVEELKQKRDELSARLSPAETEVKGEQIEVAENIGELKVKRAKLAKYLSEVEEKIGQANLSGDITERERQLQENLLVIKKENTELMTELDDAMRRK